MTKNCVGELRERGSGFYSFLYARLYEGARDPTIMRVEELRGELRSALSSVGFLPNGCAEAFLEDAPPLNTSEHGPPAQYFDDQLAGLVADRDRTVIERYGYTL